MSIRFILVTVILYRPAVSNPWAVGHVELGRGPYNININNVFI